MQLADAERRVTMTFSAESREAARLARVMEYGPQACNTVFDFVRCLARSRASRRLRGGRRRPAGMIVCLCAGIPASTIRALIERGACLDSLTDLVAEGRRPALDLASP